MTPWNTAIPASASDHTLAEGILWDDRAELVRWVDIDEGRVLAGRLHPDRIETVETVSLGQTAGAVALAEDGGLLIAVERGLATISTEGEISFGPDLLGDCSDARLNDGAVDSEGRFIVGSLRLSGAPGDDPLLRISTDGSTEVLREGVRLSNGVAFSTDQRTIYHVDTYAKTVAQHSYGPGPFDADEPWEILIDAAALEGHPDGLTVDAAGSLWVAIYDGRGVRRFAASGEPLGMLPVEAEQVTCTAFVGYRLDRMAVTTAREGLSNPTTHSGALFLADVGTRGLAPHRWSGSTTNPYWT